jgi:hypothetical protein
MGRHQLRELRTLGGVLGVTGMLQARGVAKSQRFWSKSKEMSVSPTHRAPRLGCQSVAHSASAQTNSNSKSRRTLMPRPRATDHTSEEGPLGQHSCKLIDLYGAVSVLVSFLDDGRRLLNGDLRGTSRLQGFR